MTDIGNVRSVFDMQDAHQKSQMELPKCDVGKVMGRVAMSMHGTCQSVGVMLDLPEQLAASSDSLTGASQSNLLPSAESRAAPLLSSIQRRSLQRADSKASSNSSAGMSAPALLPPPSRAALAKHKPPAVASLRAHVKSEVRLLHAEVSGS